MTAGETATDEECAADTATNAKVTAEATVEVVEARAPLLPPPFNAPELGEELLGVAATVLNGPPALMGVEDETIVTADEVALFTTLLLLRTLLVFVLTNTPEAVTEVDEVNFGI